MTSSGAQFPDASIARKDNTFSPKADRRHVKRRNYFVKKWLQTRYIVYYLSIMFASSIALFYLIHRYARVVLRTEMSQGHSALLNTWIILRPEMFRASVAVVLFVVLAAVLTSTAVVWAVRRASRTVVSNVRFYCANGDTDRWVVIQHPREFQHLQVLLTQSIASYRHRLKGLRGQVKDLEESVRSIREKGKTGEGTSSLNAIKTLQTRYSEIKHQFENFREGE